MYFDATFDQSECADIRIERVVQILKFVTVLDQVCDNRLQVVGWMETQDIVGFLNAYLVISEILNMIDDQMNRHAQLFLNGCSNQVAYLSHGVITRGNVKDA